MTAPRLSLTTLVERPDLAILRGTPPQSRGAPVIVFVSGGESKQAEPKAEFLPAMAALGRPALFVIDRTLCWYAQPGAVDTILAHIEAEMRASAADHVDTVGFSMGASGAIGFAERVPVRYALAMAPRYSPDWAIVPDPRLRPRLSAFSGRFPFERLDPGLARLKAGLILTGTTGPDLPHMARMRIPPHIERWLMPGIGHHVAQELRRQGLILDLFQAALGDDPSALTAVLRRMGAYPAREMPMRLRATLLAHRYRHRIPGKIWSMIQKPVTARPAQ